MISLLYTIIVTPTMSPTMTPTMTPNVAADGLSTVTTTLIIIVVLLFVALAMVALGIVLFETLRRKAVCVKQPGPTTDVDTLYDEIDEGQTGTAVALRSVGNLQTITNLDPLYEAMDDTEVVSQFECSLIVPTASCEVFGVTSILTSLSDDVPTDHNTAYGVTTSPASDDVPTGPNIAYGVTSIVDLAAEVNSTTLGPVQETESGEEDYI